jgi:hypothetical protein
LSGGGCCHTSLNIFDAIFAFYLLFVDFLPPSQLFTLAVSLVGITAAAAAVATATAPPQSC